MKTICHYVKDFPTRSADRIAVKYCQEDKWIDLSWNEYFQEIQSIAIALLNLGVQPGDKVGLMAQSRLEWAVADYATLGIQSVLVPIYPTITPEDMRHIINDSQIKILILENRNHMKAFNIIKSECPSIEKVFCLNEDLDDAPSWKTLKNSGRGLEEKLGPRFLELLQSTTLDSVASIIYTSGTTGKPKGAVITHRQIMSEVGEAFPYMGVTPDDTALSFLPYSHVMGRIDHWGHAFTGHTLAFAESIDAVKKNLIDIKPTFLIAVPRIFEKVYSAIMAQMEANPVKAKLFKWALSVGKKVSHHQVKREPLPLALFAEYKLAQSLVLDKVKAAFGGRIRFCVSGGAPLALDISQFFHACGILILEGYGLTETTAAICLNAPFDYEFGTVGKPLRDVQIKIAADGEILVKSEKVMKEYHQNQEATAEVMTEGWLHTGDIGEFTSSGNLKITDRKKDLIKTAGGKYVAPQKIENLLKLNTYISHSLIHGDQRKYIVALITLDKPNIIKFAKANNLQYDDFPSLTQHPQVLDLIRKCVAETNSSLASFESIKRFSILPTDFTVESGELTPSLKVKRKLLDQKYKKQIDSLYS